MELESYVAQRKRWPSSGRHILANFDEQSIVVYQAYHPAIAEAAVRDQQLGGGGWNSDRMSWIKPNFLWMMYRCGWATKANQERVLALRVQRTAFDQWLARVVHSKFIPEVYADNKSWERAVQSSDVRLQWDPDHDPHGQRQERRALQLGLRDDALQQLARTALLSVEDLTSFVHEQHKHVQAHTLDALLMPKEDVYPVSDLDTKNRLGLAD